MIFELFPNEIFLELFDYLDGTDLFQGFYGLNNRFNNLLYDHYRTFRFNFHSISKRSFHTICYQHLPRIADRVISLSFSNLHEFPEQMYLFFSYIPSIDLFTHLQSLSLTDINQYELVETILEQCRHLNHLTHLKCQFDIFSDHSHLWSLSKLVHCEMSFLSLGQIRLHLTNQSISLKRLSLNNSFVDLYQLNQLFDCTPHLKDLQVSLHEHDLEYRSTSHPSLIRLNIFVLEFVDSSRILLLLQTMSNLQSLTIIISCIIRGHQWEELINNYIPKLSEFRLKMTESISRDRTELEQMNEITESFRNPFWITVHRWFVRCFILDDVIHLHTLPRIHPQKNLSIPRFFSSTDPNDGLDKFCNDIIGITELKFFDQLKQSPLPLMNIEDLIMRMPIEPHFWHVFPNLNQLHSLTVYANVSISQFLFQDLFDQTPHLRQLTIYLNKFAFGELLLLTRMTTSLRQVNIHHDLSYFNEEECLAFSRSTLAEQCEELSINVWNGESILLLIENLSQLRLLRVSCYDIAFRHYSSTETDQVIDKRKISIDDELVGWLREHLSSSCIITKTEQSVGHFRIWM